MYPNNLPGAVLRDWGMNSMVGTTLFVKFYKFKTKLIVR